MKFSIPPLFRPATWTLTAKDPIKALGQLPERGRGYERALATQGSTAASHREAETSATAITAPQNNCLH